MQFSVSTNAVSAALCLFFLVFFCRSLIVSIHSNRQNEKRNISSILFQFFFVHIFFYFFAFLCFILEEKRERWKNVRENISIWFIFFVSKRKPVPFRNMKRVTAETTVSRIVFESKLDPLRVKCAKYLECSGAVRRLTMTNLQLNQEDVCQTRMLHLWQLWFRSKFGFDRNYGNNFWRNRSRADGRERTRRKLWH